jgi:hypothetical protein
VLVASSDVFAAQLEGGYYKESSGQVRILDTEPAYMRSLLQFIYTGHLPLLSLHQAFELLYLAKKYILKVRKANSLPKPVCCGYEMFLSRIRIRNPVPNILKCNLLQ